MKTILKKGIAVNCKTLNEARELKKIAEENGIGWYYKCSNVDTIWSYQKEITCFSVTNFNELISVETWIYKDKGYKIISFAEFKQFLNQHWKSAISEHLIKGNKTIIKLSNGRVGTANCLPTDKFNEGVGAVIAVAKAYNVDLKEVVKLTEKPKEPELYYAKDIVGKWAKVKIAGWQDCERKIIFADNKKIVYLYREGNRLGYTEDKEAFGKNWQLI